jgi:hypothetical protein
MQAAIMIRGLKTLALPLKKSIPKLRYPHALMQFHITPRHLAFYTNLDARILAAKITKRLSTTTIKQQNKETRLRTVH